jgi:hypothetical protein
MKPIQEIYDFGHVVSTVDNTAVQELHPKSGGSTVYLVMDYVHNKVAIIRTMEEALTEAEKYRLLAHSI